MVRSGGSANRLGKNSRRIGTRSSWPSEHGESLLIGNANTWTLSTVVLRLNAQHAGMNSWTEGSTYTRTKLSTELEYASRGQGL